MREIKPNSSSFPRAFEYAELGRGPVLLFLHGLFGHHTNWLPMMEALAPDFRVIALEYPFFDDRTLHSVRALTDYTLDFIGAQGLDPVSLCGNSLGGQIALELALNHRERVSKLVLTGSAGLWEAQANGQLPKATRAFIRQQAERVFFDPRHVDDELIEKLYESLKDRTYVRTLLRLARDTQGYTLHNRLEHVRVPVLLVWGENDLVTPPEVARTFHEHIPCSRLVFLPECGHAPPLEQPEGFTEEIRKFMYETA